MFVVIRMMLSSSMVTMKQQQQFISIVYVCMLLLIAVDYTHASCVSNDDCLNDGLCLGTCVCAFGWGGEFCDIDMADCPTSNPCFNGGYCQDLNDGFNNWECVCPSGWGGSICDVDVEECSINPCLNGGNCIETQPDGAGAYTCSCVSPFQGDDCEIDVAVQYVFVTPLFGNVENDIILTVQAVDQNGYLVPDYSGSFSLFLTGDAFFISTNPQILFSGQATISVEDTTVETVIASLTTTDGLATTDTASLTFTEGPAVLLELVNPINSSADATVSITVRALDAFNNLAISYNGSIGVLQNDTHQIGSLILGEGVVSFPPFENAGTYHFSLNDTFSTGLALSGNVDILIFAASVSEYVLEPIPHQSVDSVVAVTVRAYDIYGNFVSSHGSEHSVTLSSAVGDVNGTFSGGEFIALFSVSSVGPFSVMIVDSGSSGFALGPTETTELSNGLPTTFFLVPPFPQVVNVPVVVSVLVHDQFGNLVPSGNYSVDVLLPNSVTCFGELCNTMITTSYGVGTLNVINTVAETGTLSLQDTYSMNFFLTSANISFIPDDATELLLVVPINGSTTDSPALVTVIAVDQYGNIDFNFVADNVTVLADQGATVDPPTQEFFLGQAVFAVSTNVANIYVAVEVVDFFSSTLTFPPTEIVFFGIGAPHQFQLLVNSTSVNVGEDIDILIVAMDSNYNPIDFFIGSVTLTLSGIEFTSVTFTGSSAELVQFTEYTVSTVSIGLKNGNGLLTNSSATVSFIHGPAVLIIIDHVITVNVDSNVTVRVVVLDLFGNVATDEADTPIMVGVLPPVTGSPFGAIAIAGEALIEFSVIIAQNYSLFLIDVDFEDFALGPDVEFAVSHGIAAQLVLIVPVNASVDTGTLIAVEAYDQYNNFVFDDNSTVSLDLSGSAGIGVGGSFVPGGGIMSLSSGMAQITISNLVAETILCSLVDIFSTGLIVSSSVTLTFVSGNAISIIFTNNFSGIAGSDTLISVQAIDLYGNVDFNYAGIVTVRVFEDHGEHTFLLTPLFSGFGVANFTTTVAEVYTVNILDTESTGMVVSDSTNVTIFPAEGDHFSLSQQLYFGTVDDNITVIAELHDAFSNVITTFSSETFIFVVENGTGTITQSSSGFTDGFALCVLTDDRPETLLISVFDSTYFQFLSESSSAFLTFFTGEPVAVNAVATPSIISVDIVGGTNVTVVTVDQYGNVASMNATFVADINPAAPGSPFIVVVTDGVGSFSLNMEIAQEVTINMVDVSSTGLSMNSANVIFEHGVAIAAVILDPVDTTVDVNMPVTVQAHDQYGNIDDLFYGDIDIILDGNALGVSGFASLSSGQVVFYMSNTIAETVVLSLSDPYEFFESVSSVENATFFHGVLTDIVIEASDIPVTAGFNTIVTVVAIDQYGNIGDSFTGVTTLLVEGTGAVISDDLQSTGYSSLIISLISGIGNAFLFDTTAEVVALSLSDSGETNLNVSSTYNVTFIAAAPSHFTIIKSVDAVVVGTTIPVTVSINDQYGNIASTVTTTVSVITSGASLGAGEVSFTGSFVLYLFNTVAETVFISLLDSFSSGYIVSASETVTWNADIAVAYNLEAPVATSVDEVLTVTVNAVDIFGNIDSGHSSIIELIASNVNILGTGLITLTDGHGTRDIFTTVASDHVTLMLLNTTATGLDFSAQIHVDFFAGAVTTLTLSNPFDNQTVDTAIYINVYSRDQHGNINHFYHGTVDVVISYLNNTISVGLFFGIGFVDVSTFTAETVVLSLANPSDELDVSDTLHITFLHGVPFQLVMVDPGIGALTVDASVLVTVQIQDQYGNVATSHPLSSVTMVSNSATVSINGGVLGTAATFNLTSGTATASIASIVAEIVVLTLQDTALLGYENSKRLFLKFETGVASSIVILDPSDTVNAGDMLLLTVHALDQFGQVSSQGGGLQVSSVISNDGNFFNVNFNLETEGIAISAIFPTVSGSYVMSLVDSFQTGLSLGVDQNFVVPPAEAVTLVILDPSDSTTSSSSTVTVQALDAFNNVANFYGNVLLSTSGSASGGGIITLIDGNATTVLENTVVETVFISLFDLFATNLDVSSTQDINFVVSDVSHYVFLPPLSPATVDNVVLITVRAKDFGGNVDLAHNINLGISAVGSDGPVNIATDIYISSGQGVATLSSFIPQTVSLHLIDSQSTNSDVSSVAYVEFIIGDPQKLLLTSNDTSISVDSVMTITVQVIDSYGNVVSLATSVELTSLSGNVQGVGELAINSGVGSAILTSDVAETTQLVLVDTANSGLEMTQLQVIFTSSTPHHFQIFAPSYSSVSEDVSVIVTLRDSKNNIITDSSNYPVVIQATGSTTGGGGILLIGGTGSRTFSATNVHTVTFFLLDSFGTGLNFSEEFTAATMEWIAGPADKLLFVEPDDGVATGEPLAITVYAIDAFGNVVNDTDISFELVSSTAELSGQGTHSLVDGQAVINISHSVLETVILSLACNLTVGPSVSVQFAAGTATQIVILQPASVATAGSSIIVTVQAQDSNGNHQNSNDVPVTLSMSNGLTQFILLRNGVIVRFLTSHVAGILAFGLSDTSFTGMKVSSVQYSRIVPRTPAEIIIALDSNTTWHVGEEIEVLLTAFDQFGNAAYNYDGFVSLLIDSANAHPIGSSLIHIAGGVGSARIVGTAIETVTLGLESQIELSFNAVSITFVAGAAAKINFMYSGAHTVNTFTDIVVDVVVTDIHDHILDERINVSLIVSAISGKASMLLEISNGVYSFTISRDAIGKVTYTLSDDFGTGLFVDGAVLTLHFVHGASSEMPKKALLSVAEANFADYDFKVTVTVYNFAGNVDETFNDNITVNSVNSNIQLEINGGIGTGAFRLTSDELGLSSGDRDPVYVLITAIMPVPLLSVHKVVSLFAPFSLPNATAISNYMGTIWACEVAHGCVSSSDVGRTWRKVDSSITHILAVGRDDNNFTVALVQPRTFTTQPLILFSENEGMSWKEISLSTIFNATWDATNTVTLTRRDVENSFDVTYDVSLAGDDLCTPSISVNTNGGFSIGLSAIGIYIQYDNDVSGEWVRVFKWST